jgi:tRNA(Glu) U13 pseudouridine synthase TruD
MTWKYESPEHFLPRRLLQYVDISRLPNSSLYSSVAELWMGTIKRSPEDFEVVEPVPEYPFEGIDVDGLSRGHRRNENARYLTTGAATDMPGLKTDFELTIELQKNGPKVPAVAATLVKRKLTTWSAVDWLAKHLSRLLGRPVGVHQIHSSGLKDRWAVTAQTIVISGVTMAEMRRIDPSQWPWTDGKAGFFLKDVRPTSTKVYKGDHLSNGFNIKVRMDGKSRAEIDEYMWPRVQFLERNGWLIPNAFGRQRLGRRQNLHLMGRTLLVGDYEAPADVNPFLTASEAAMFRFLFETSGNEKEEATRLREALMPMWQFNFSEMERTLRYEYKKVNLSFEYDIARRLAATDDFGGGCETVMYDLRDRVSLFVGAWQAFYFNAHLDAELASGRLSPGEHVGYPLPMHTADTRRTYNRNSYGQQCLRELAICNRLAEKGEPYLDAAIRAYWSGRPRDSREQPDPMGLSLGLVRSLFENNSQVRVERPPTPALSAALVKRLFLVPRDRKTGEPKSNAPWRAAFVKVKNFHYSCEDGVLNLSFALRSGAYATTLAGLLVNTDEPEEVTVEAETDIEGVLA